MKDINKRVSNANIVHVYIQYVKDVLYSVIDMEAYHTNDFHILKVNPRTSELYFFNLKKTLLQ